jgi:tRNA(fMet)-specific endonuclease VapC
LFYGAMKSTDPVRTLTRQMAFLAWLPSFPFDDRAAGQYGRIRAVLELRGTPIGSNDLMIAAIALANSLTLVTHNLREFGRIAGLRIDDWEASSGR